MRVFCYRVAAVEEEILSVKMEMVFIGLVEEAVWGRNHHEVLRGCGAGCNLEKEEASYHEDCGGVVERNHYGVVVEYGRKDRVKMMMMNYSI